ncbi:5-oxoprolinase subunit C family protein [Neolewinella persica]|uniref:5-oxoprolinase subunit C family protein n=1 Tax=Neolewinella persica TaxID=70998 RepID=UPI00037C6C72|nr:biotin-dependent carboxyltransferase family protein [Neolewinella persica]
MAGTLTVRCLKPGGGAFVVDGGRPGYRAQGIATGGAADLRAQSAANRLLGRPDQATCLELTLVGGHWLLSGKGQFVLTGADMNWRLNGRLLESYTVHYLDGDGLLTGSMAVQGLRGYLAILGTWPLPEILGSAETGLPGMSPVTTGWTTSVNWEAEVPYQSDLEVHLHFPSDLHLLSVSPGPEWVWLTPAQQAILLKQVFLVSPDSNRQGIRLTGQLLPFQLPSLISSPVLPGTVQLTPAGPILLGPEAQTVGGYPRVLLANEPANLAAAFQAAIGGEVQFIFQK